MQLTRTQLTGPACWVCSRRFKCSVPPGPEIRNDHHLFPRNAGGTDGPLVSLCTGHHNTLHLIAKRSQSGGDVLPLLATESPQFHKKLLWMASLVVKAERLFGSDENKTLGLSISLSRQEMQVLDALAARHGLSRKQVVLLGLKLLAQR